MKSTILLTIIFTGAWLRAADVPANFAQQSPSPATANLQQWWLNFRDPQLTGLITDALANNPNLATSTARVREARARRLATFGDYWPQLRIGGGVSRGIPFSGNGNFVLPGGGPGTQNLYNLTTDASWEIDVFGGIRHSVAAAEAQTQAAEEARKNVLISLTAEIAANYVDLRGHQSQLAVLNANLASQEKTVSLTKSRLEAGLSPELAVAQAEAQLAITRAAIPTLKAGVAAAIHRIGTLTGKAAGTYLSVLDKPRPIPTGPATVPAGFPSDLLQRRPDVRQAERNYAAATSQVGSARAARLPKFTIGGSAKLESTRSETLLDKDSRVYSIGPSISIPLFNAGKLKQNQRAAEAARDAAQATWDAAVLTAIEDVETALITYRQSQSRLESLRAAEKASARAHELANELFKNGLGDFLNVLEAQRTLLNSQEQVVLAEHQVSMNLVKLYKALGGGWEQTAAAPTK